MGHHRLFYYDPKVVRQHLNQALGLAQAIHTQEGSLVELLKRIDQNRLCVRYGYKSLTGFCRFDLKFSKTQAQRLVTKVRRLEPTDNIVDEHTPPS
jgi:hypothetical protein